MAKVIFENMEIENFRKIKEVNVKFGNKITVISGRNGTGKSSILGLISQCLSFRNVSGNTDIDFKTIFGGDFESEFKNHLKISDKYDTPDKKYKINIKLRDDETEYYLGTTRRNNQIRFVLRGNSDRNFTLPSIYLDLRRLTPMVYRKENDVKTLDLNDQEKHKIIEWTNEVFPSLDEYEQITSNLPDKDINSMVATGSYYDIKVASSGEDNLGQIFGALISFDRLKKEFKNYSGGILLIDELDATLFPLSQKRLIDLLIKLASRYNLQIIFTTHSPTILNHLFDIRENTLLDSKTKDDIAINYFTNKSGKIENMKYDSIIDIFDDLEYRTKKKTKQKDDVDSVKVYVEDDEAREMLKRILTNINKKQIDIQEGVKLGGEQYISLITSNVKEFKKNSVIVLDGDKISEFKNVLTLPFDLPPDQLIYHYLSNLEPDDPYWQNDFGFDKTNFVANKKVSAIKSNLEYKEGKYVLKASANNGRKSRDFFKDFYNDNQIKDLMRTRGCNVFTKLKHINREEIEKFNLEFVEAVQEVRNNKYL